MWQADRRLPRGVARPRNSTCLPRPRPSTLPSSARRWGPSPTIRYLQLSRPDVTSRSQDFDRDIYPLALHDVGNADDLETDSRTRRAFLAKVQDDRWRWGKTIRHHPKMVVPANDFAKEVSKRLPDEDNPIRILEGLPVACSLARRPQTPRGRVDTVNGDEAWNPRLACCSDDRRSEILAMDVHEFVSAAVEGLSDDGRKMPVE